MLYPTICYNHLLKGEREMSEQLAEKTLDQVEVHTTLYKPFYEFLKELLAFYGSKETIEDISRQIIYEYIRGQYERIHDLICKDAVTKTYRQTWFDKWDKIAITCGPDEEE